MAKKIAIAALALVAISIPLMGIGLIFGVSTTYIDGGGLHVQPEQPEEIRELLSSYDGTATVSITVASENLIIERGGTEFGYHITNRSGQSFEHSLSRDRLVIDQRSGRGAWVMFGWNNFVPGKRLPTITVYIPEDMYLEKLDIEMASGAVRVTGIDAASVEINGASGNFTATDLTVDRELDVEVVSGSTHVSGDLRGDLTFNSVSGNLDIEIDGAAADYQRAIEAVSGNITVSDPSGKLNSSTLVTSDSSGNRQTSGANRLEIEAVSGNISVRFLR